MKTAKQSLYTPFHRILHWTVALSMILLFITGFLRMNWMSKKTIRSAVETAVGPDIQLTKVQMGGITKSILGPMWQWHEYAAWVIFFLFVARMVYMLVKGIRFPNPFKSSDSFRDRMQGLAYMAFYLFTAVSLVTGFYLKFGSGEWGEPMEAIHKWGLYWFPVYLLIHAIGVVAGELSTRKGVVSKMIGGD